jgi:signal recognition particle subunit SEC65
MCKQSPTVEMIGEAARRLNLPHKIVSDAAYPRLPWRKTGLVLVKRIKGKGQILQEIAKEIAKLHT